MKNVSNEIAIKKKSDDNSNHYVDNEKFLEALTEYKLKYNEAKALGKEKPIVSNYIGDCFMKIAHGVARRHSFMLYSFKDEMIMDGVENCLLYCHNFDPTKEDRNGKVNPFAYFSQIIIYAFLRRIEKEKEEMYVKYKSAENIEYEYDLDFDDTIDRETLQNYKKDGIYGNLKDFIYSFEESKRKKKEKKKESLNKTIADKITTEKSEDS